MKLELLANTLEGRRVTGRQHFTCFVLNGGIAVDAGCLANATTAAQKRDIRDVVLTHAHLDHIAGLPLFIDDLFDILEEPVRIHASAEVIDVLENDVFNWRVYPRFSELTNSSGPVMEYRVIREGEQFELKGLAFEAVGVNHKVPSFGFVITDESARVAITGDTAQMDGFWERLNALDDLDALLIECAFPNRMRTLAEVSHHLTPELLANELDKFEHPDCQIFVVNLKPMYRSETASEIDALERPNLKILELGEEYEF